MVSWWNWYHKNTSSNSPPYARQDFSSTPWFKITVTSQTILFLVTLSKIKKGEGNLTSGDKTWTITFHFTYYHAVGFLSQNSILFIWVTRKTPLLSIAALMPWFVFKIETPCPWNLLWNGLEEIFLRTVQKIIMTEQTPTS